MEDGTAVASDLATVLAQLWGGGEAEAHLALLDRYHRRLVEHLAITEELLHQAEQLDASADGVADSVALLRAVAGHLGDKGAAVRRLMCSLEESSADGRALADPAAVRFPAAP